MIVDKNLKSLNKQTKDREVVVLADDSAKDWLCDGVISQDLEHVK